MVTLPFWKVESIGNDFVLVHRDDLEAAYGTSPNDRNLAALAVQACARHFGVGSDGLLVLGLDRDESLTLRMFNPDGTEDFCGNGIRCAIDHALRRGWVSPDDIRMLHRGHPVRARARPYDEHFEGMEWKSSRAETKDLASPWWIVEFELESATYSPPAIPLLRPTEAFDTELLSVDGIPYFGSVLSTGTAHTILTVKELPDDDEFFRVSTRLENDPMYPERTSVMWTKQKTSNEIVLRIWERGAGETLGCGTGSTAAALDTLRRMGKGGRLRVVNPGGTLVVEAAAWNAPPRITGVALEIYTGVLSAIPSISA